MLFENLLVSEDFEFLTEGARELGGSGEGVEEGAGTEEVEMEGRRKPGFGEEGVVGEDDSVWTEEEVGGIEGEERGGGGRREEGGRGREEEGGGEGKSGGGREERGGGDRDEKEEGGGGKEEGERGGGELP